MINGTPLFRANPGNKNAFNDGRRLGHQISAVAGLLEAGIGGTSGLVEAVSLGVATPVALPAAAAGLGLMGYSANASLNAAYNLRDDKGRAYSKSRNKPNQQGIPNSSEIQSRNPNGKVDKYTTYDNNGNPVKKYRGPEKIMVIYQGLM
ncbi:hypothetical protein [Siphonobacter curvatus]|uniref:Bacterial toxin 24 domain-containing protein n=1 Tax=Siphonobacter curvatus TaxID=2094562 RepID=A0A2S7IF20_9BACT|nr:hypothetical protein [Siphonobacter curvatus]PQA53422.1 hypothetical protein C5O19_24565 [Siphonobacter curvatus]